MPRRIFPASTVTNITGAPLRLTFYSTSTTNRRETDLWTVDGSNNLVERIPNGVILTDSANPGAYSAFAGPDDIDTLYLNAHNGDSRSAITATGTLTGGTAYAKTASNLSDLASASTARTNLGLGASAVMSTAQIAADSALTGVFASGALTPAPQKQPKLTSITTFQSGHGWTNGGSGGTWSLNDTGDYVIGSQCVSVATDGTNGSFWVQKMGFTAVDLTTRDILLWIKCTNVTNFKSLHVYCTSDSLTNYVHGNVIDVTYGVPPQGLLRGGEWFPLRFNIADLTSTVGSPVTTAITGIRIAPTDIGGGSTTTVKFGGLFTYPRPTATYPNGVVTLGFDDSFTSHRTIAAPYLAKYGWAGTAYTICNAISDSGIGGGAYGMTLAQLRELRDIYGWELAAHAYTVANHTTSFPSLSASALAAEVSQMVNWLQNNQALTSNHFAYPLGKQSAATDVVIGKYFSTGRTLMSLPLEVQQPGMPLRTRAIQISTGLTSTATAAIDKAYTNGNWLQLVFHDIVASAATGNQTLTSELQTIVDYCSTKGIAVATASDVWRAGSSGAESLTLDGGAP